MNFARTALLLAAMTGLFLAIGYLLAGEGGLLIALPGGARHERLGVLELRSDGAAHARCAAGDAGPARPSCSAWSSSWHAAPGCRCPRSTCSRPASRTPSPPGATPSTPPSRSPAACSRRCDPRGAGGRARPRARPHQAPRHADHDDHRDARRRDRLSRAVRLLLRHGPRPAQQPARVRRHAPGDDPRPARRDAGPDGDLPDPRILGRPRRRRDLGPPALARPRARRRSSSWRAARSTRPPSATRRPPICSSSTRCTWAGSTTCSAPTPRPRTASAACRSWPAPRARRPPAAAPGAEPWRRAADALPPQVGSSWRPASTCLASGPARPEQGSSKSMPRTARRKCPTRLRPETRYPVRLEDGQHNGRKKDFYRSGLNSIVTHA